MNQQRVKGDLKNIYAGTKKKKTTTTLQLVLEMVSFPDTSLSQVLEHV